MWSRPEDAVSDPGKRQCQPDARMPEREHPCLPSQNHAADERQRRSHDDVDQNRHIGDDGTKTGDQTFNAVRSIRMLNAMPGNTRKSWSR